MRIRMLFLSLSSALVLTLVNNSNFLSGSVAYAASRCPTGHSGRNLAVHKPERARMAQKGRNARKETYARARIRTGTSEPGSVNWPLIRPM